MIILAGVIVFTLFILLRKKQPNKQRRVLLLLLFLILALHFLKTLFPPYSTNPEILARDIWFINICAVSILLFPFFFLSKEKHLNDFLVYLGLISGFLALFIPTEALNKNLLTLDVIRFYITHIILFAVPFLMVVLKIHRPDYKRILYTPLIMLSYYIMIIFQQVIQSELGFVPLRSGDFFNPNYRNNSFIWGPGNDELAALFKIFTPKFLKTVPYGPYVGQIKYWPFFWLIPATFIYFTSIRFLLNLFWDYSRIKNNFKTKVSIFRKQNI
jgi:uncharacterized membrane protein YwaF